MYSATVHSHAGEKLVFVKGAVEKLVQISNKVIYSEGTRDLNGGEVLQEADELAREGLRVRNQ